MVTEKSLSDRKQDILGWACKRSAQQIDSRINVLIDVALGKKVLKEISPEDAKFECAELVGILKRRASVLTQRENRL